MGYLYFVSMIKCIEWVVMVRVDKKVSIIFLIWLKKLGGVFVYLI